MDFGEAFSLEKNEDRIILTKHPLQISNQQLGALRPKFTLQRSDLEFISQHGNFQRVVLSRRRFPCLDFQLSPFKSEPPP